MQGKHAIFAGLAAGILFAVALFSAGSHGGVAHAAAKPEGKWMQCPTGQYLKGDGACQAPPDSGSDFATANQSGQLSTTLPPFIPQIVVTPYPATDSVPITIIKADGVVSPRPLSAVVVTSCGLAVALYIQLDATHLLRADPRQSDLFTAVNGEQRQDSAGPMKWDDAYALAQSAVLTSHVLLPCTDGPRA